MLDETELLLRILSDTGPPGAVEAAYLFAQTQPNQDSVFAAARELLNRNAVEKILISDCRAKSGYPGAAAWRAALADHGISADAVDEVPTEPTEILHTLIEAQAVVRLARVRDYRRLVVVAAPFHQQRAVMTTISVALREHPRLRIYSRPGASQRWDEVVTHSQGTLKATRAELIAEERRRIEIYTAQGDLAERADILEYLRWRDQER
ncbi:MAG: YdcF family protein [Phycisphaerae bacterium]|nr:YdcF family protein [Phycisphaerae bacterium]